MRAPRKNEPEGVGTTERRPLTEYDIHAESETIFENKPQGAIKQGILRSVAQRSGSGTGRDAYKARVIKAIWKVAGKPEVIENRMLDEWTICRYTCGKPWQIRFR